MKTKLANLLKHPLLWIFFYLLFVLIYTLFFWLGNPSPKVMLDSNELGDFLAGAFAPIAFIFLFLGYKQQGEAINKSNQAIIEQLLIQKNMLDLQKAERTEREHAAQPIIEHYFTVQNHLTSAHENMRRTATEIFYREIILTLKNSGEKISQVHISCKKPFSKNIIFNAVLGNSSELKANLVVKESELKKYAIDGYLDLEIYVDYRISLGAKFRIKYELQISKSLLDHHVMYTATSNPFKILQ